MVNCASNNKNSYAFAFASLLTARRVFDIVEVVFLLVAHTHEDIYGIHRRLSTQIN